MNTNIVEQAADGALIVTSETIAEGSGVEHRAVLQLISNNMADFEEFGQVAFEMRPRLSGQHGGGDVRIAMLNEQQSTLLMTYQRNTDQVKAFKLALVKAFFQMAKQLQAPAFDINAINPRTLALAILEESDRADAADARARELEAPALAWEKLASATGDYSVRDAAQVLCRDAGIQIGQNRLFAHLKSAARPWLDKNTRPYQWAVDAGLVAEKISSFKFTRTNGAEQLATPQVRITAKGLQRLQAELSPSKALVSA